MSYTLLIEVNGDPGGDTGDLLTDFRHGLAGCGAAYGTIQSRSELAYELRRAEMRRSLCAVRNRTWHELVQEFPFVKDATLTELTALHQRIRDRLV